MIVTVSSVVGIVGAVAAVVTIFLTRRHFKKTEKRDLYNRRIEYFNTIAAYLARVLSEDRVNEGEEVEFLRKMKNIEFVFEKEIEKYVDDIYNQSIELQRLDYQMRKAQGKEYENVLDKREAIISWFQNEMNQVRKKFVKYLDLAS
jgi:hypothetical protein